MSDMTHLQRAIERARDHLAGNPPDRNATEVLMHYDLVRAHTAGVDLDTLVEWSGLLESRVRRIVGATYTPV